MSVTFSLSKKENALRRLIRRGITAILGFDIVHAYDNRKLLASAEVVITHTEHEHLAVAALVKLRVIPPTKIVGQSIWLWDEWGSLGLLKVNLYRRLLSEIDLHTTHSPSNARFGSNTIGHEVFVVPYGANFEKYSLQAGLEARKSVDDVIMVLAAGNDRHRDWKTLVGAAATSPSINVTIMSRRLKARAAALRCASRVSVTSAKNNAEMERMLASHDVVVLPLRPNLHASGLTVLFESVLSRRPAAVTRTGGLETYAEGLVSWAKPGDVVSLREAIKDAYARRNDSAYLEGRRDKIVQKGLTIADYGLRHVLAAWVVLGYPVHPTLLTAAEPILPLVLTLDEEFRR